MPRPILGTFQALLFPQLLIVGMVGMEELIVLMVDVGLVGATTGLGRMDPGGPQGIAMMAAGNVLLC